MWFYNKFRHILIQHMPAISKWTRKYFVNSSYGMVLISNIRHGSDWLSPIASKIADTKNPLDSHHYRRHRPSLCHRHRPSPRHRQTTHRQVNRYGQVLKETIPDRFLCVLKRKRQQQQQQHVFTTVCCAADGDTRTSQHPQYGLDIYRMHQPQVCNPIPGDNSNNRTNDGHGLAILFRSLFEYEWKVQMWYTYTVFAFRMSSKRTKLWSRS